MKLETIIVAPVEGRHVRKPDGALLEHATSVDNSPYWQRRLLDGDVERAKKETSQ